MPGNKCHPQVHEKNQVLLSLNSSPAGVTAGTSSLTHSLVRLLLTGNQTLTSTFRTCSVHNKL